MKLHSDTDTIVAQATPPGRGGVAIVRISGPKTLEIANHIVPLQLKPRFAHHTHFLGAEKEIIDTGIALFFPGPDSFTGEDVLELQCHGGPVIVDLLIRRAVSLAARIARPGEFSERAFLNDKIDLIQAEAIADLIDASSEQAARNAQRSLQGAFSERIHTLVEELVALRIYVEAAIDFPEEEIDFLTDGKVLHDLEHIMVSLSNVMIEANRGVLIKEGMKVVLAGKPNSGKSSLLNALAGRESAIVTAIAGTTRDILREHIHIDGMPLHITDTAGLRESGDEVEQEGIRRAWKEIRDADRILMLVDATEISDLSNPEEFLRQILQPLPGRSKAEPFGPDLSIPDPSTLELPLPDLSRLSLIINKIDLSGTPAAIEKSEPAKVYLSAKTGEGVDLLRQHLKEIMGFSSETEGSFSARQRHTQALNNALEALRHGRSQLVGAGAGELLAEDLRLAQQHLGEITGQISADDLLGKIFSSFCIGK